MAAKRNIEVKEARRIASDLHITYLILFFEECPCFMRYYDRSLYMSKLCTGDSYLTLNTSDNA